MMRLPPSPTDCSLRQRLHLSRPCLLTLTRTAGPNSRSSGTNPQSPASCLQIQINQNNKVAVGHQHHGPNGIASSAKGSLSCPSYGRQCRHTPPTSPPSRPSQQPHDPPSALTLSTIPSGDALVDKLPQRRLSQRRRCSSYHLSLSPSLVMLLQSRHPRQARQSSAPNPAFALSEWCPPPPSHDARLSLSNRLRGVTFSSSAPFSLWQLIAFETLSYLITPLFM